MPDNGNSNIQVEITDASEFHCFRLVFNPRTSPTFGESLAETHDVFVAYQMRRGATPEEAEQRWSTPGHAADLALARREAGLPGTPAEAAEAAPHIEIMLHARSLVDLIHKCSEALCDWQTQTSAHLIDLLTKAKMEP